MPHRAEICRLARERIQSQGSSGGTPGVDYKYQAERKAKTMSVYLPGQFAPRLAQLD